MYSLFCLLLEKTCIEEWNYTLKIINNYFEKINPSKAFFKEYSSKRFKLEYYQVIKFQILYSLKCSVPWIGLFHYIVHFWALFKHFKVIIIISFIELPTVQLLFVNKFVSLGI